MPSPAPFVLAPGSPHYPPALLAGGEQSAPPLQALGDIGLLQGPLLALFCSKRCPGRLILEAYDLAQRLRQSGRAVVGGFHTPVEQECLRVLLRGPAPTVVCPARSLERLRLPAAWRGPLEGGRLLVLSPFPAHISRATADSAERRNAFVAALAAQVLVLHAAPGSKTERMCGELLRQGKPVYTLGGEENANLLALGARVFGPAHAD